MIYLKDYYLNYITLRTTDLKNYQNMYFVQELFISKYIDLHVEKINWIARIDT